MRPDITLLVMTDGRRDCIERTIASAEVQLLGNITRRLIHDDSGDPLYRDWLSETFPGYAIVHQHKRRGFGGAVAGAWRTLSLMAPMTEFVFHLEDDFTFPEPVDLDRIAEVLRPRPYLVQMALQRQPWNDTERAAGGVIAAMDGDYLEVTDGQDAVWVEHRRFWTTNPSLVRSERVAAGWPDVPGSEGLYTGTVLQDPEARFAYWGNASDPPKAHHIGLTRVGTGYW